MTPVEEFSSEHKNEGGTTGHIVTNASLTATIDGHGVASVGSNADKRTNTKKTEGTEKSFGE